MGVVGYATRASNALATFNCLVTQLFRPHRGYVQTYFDYIFVHSHAEQGRSVVENHIDHLRAAPNVCARTNCMPVHLNAFLAQNQIFFRVLHWKATL